MRRILFHTLKTGQNQKKKEHHPERNDYGPETERRREKERETERWNFKKK